LLKKKILLYTILISLVYFDLTCSKRRIKFDKPIIIKGVRYVEVLSANNHDSYLHISQLVVKDSKGVNIAESKHATAISIWPGTSPSFAVDGIEVSRAYPKGYISRGTMNEKFSVDLGADSDVSQVVYYNRRDCCQKRIIGARINLLDANKNILGFYIIKTGDLKTIIDKFDKPIIIKGVRYVEVLSANIHEGYLQISQLAIKDSKGVNIAKNMPATASSIWPETELLVLESIY